MSEIQPQAAPMDRYMVMEYLAEGGMGAIYLGKKLGAGGFEKQVVLKQLLPEYTRQPEFIDLFLREARLSASLDHANIIHTIDLVTAGEEYFIVMEYLDGADLRTLARRAKRRQRPIAPSAGLYVAREVLSALAYAHAKTGPDGRPLALIHRDVSPSNVLISATGDVKLTDFGIAKASTHNSIFYRVKGKVGYMSPEQARSEQLDHRSDLYSLAVCLFELITGERLFVNAGLTTSADEMYSQPIPAVSEKVPGLPRELDELMYKALAVDPAARFQSAGEFQESLLRCAHRHRLLMSGPDLADHLREACGPPEIWRDEDNLGDDIPAVDQEGTEELAGLDAAARGDGFGDDAADDDSGPLEQSERERRKGRAATSVTKLSQLQGMELTSLIKDSGADNAGSEPLVDIEQIGEAPEVEGESSRLVDLGGTSAEMPAAPPPGAGPASSAAPELASGGSHPSLKPANISAAEAGAARAPSRLRHVGAIIALIALGGGVAVGIGFTGPTLDLDAERPAGAGESPADRPPGGEEAPTTGAAPDESESTGGEASGGGESASSE